MKLKCVCLMCTWGGGGGGWGGACGLIETCLPPVHLLEACGLI